MNSSFSALSTPVTSAPWELGQLDSVHAGATAAAVDQYLLPGRDLSLIADALPRDGPHLRQGRGLLVGQAGRYRRQLFLRDAYVFREPAHEVEDVGEHVIARPQLRGGRARRHNVPGDV
jgi:hypothetical protein